MRRRGYGSLLVFVCVSYVAQNEVVVDVSSYNDKIKYKIHKKTYRRAAY